MTSRSEHSLRSFSFFVRGPQSVTEALERLIDTGALYADRDEEGLPRAVRHESFDVFMARREPPPGALLDGEELRQALKARFLERARFLVERIETARVDETNARTARTLGCLDSEAFEERIERARKDRKSSWNSLSDELDELVRGLA